MLLRLFVRSAAFGVVLPEVPHYGHYVLCKGPMVSLEKPSGVGLAWLHATSDVFPFFCPCTVSGPWSFGPQPLGSGGDATPCEDPRQEHGSLYKYVAGCLLMASAHDEAGCWVPLAQRGRLSSLTHDMLTRGKVGFLTRRTGPYTAKEESNRSAASERTPLYSAITALGAAGQGVSWTGPCQDEQAPLRVTHTAETGEPSPPLPPFLPSPSPRDRGAPIQGTVGAVPRTGRVPTQRLDFKYLARYFSHGPAYHVVGGRRRIC